MKAIHILTSAALLLVATACKQELAVENLSDPDIARVFATGASIESTIAAGYQTVHNAIMNQNDQPGVEVFGLESYSSLNNFNMGTRVAIPRLPINNVNGAPSIFPEFSSLAKEARLVVNAMDALAALNKAGKTIATAQRDRRARSFGFFVAGVSLGWSAIIYDSSAIVGTGMPTDSVPPLSSAADVGKAAIVMLDSALAIANESVMTGATIDAVWLSTPSATTLDQYKRIIRSYRARIRTGVTRSVAQRNAVDWAKVIDDAENGINFNLMVSTGSSTGWSVGYQVVRYQDSGWSQMSMMYMGMADVSGAYAAFVAAPMSQKNGWFLVVTPDQRWPQGTTRAAQNTVSAVQPTGVTSRPYISNRSLSNDVAGDGWGISFYDYYRYRYIKVAGNLGPYPEFLKSENDLLAAEGYIRTGNVAAATAKIDLTRVANGGLPALTGVVTSATQQVPGGASCVPQVPTGTGTVACGNLMEAMKYEWRIENTFSGFGSFWINSRGWGDLVEGTPLEFPVPYQEMQSRQKPYYLLGPGFGSAAPKGIYGF